MNSRLLTILAVLAVTFTFAPASGHADQFTLWASDDALTGITSKSKIDGYLDMLKGHGIGGIWLTVQQPREVTVNYKKTTESGLDTADQFAAGAWSEDDFLSYVTAQARERDMKVIVKLSGSNQHAWESNPSWRMLNSRGNNVLRADGLGAFCVNSPYWETIFFSMVEEIGTNYDVDGFYFDASQVAYPSDDSCFCPNCKDRFENETGKALVSRPISRTNWANDTVKLHAHKRVEWLNLFFARYADAVQQAKPGSESILGTSGPESSYKDGVSSRNAGLHVTGLATVPFSIAGLFISEVKDEAALVGERIFPHVIPYTYWEALLKTLRIDNGGGSVTAVDLLPSINRATDVQIGLIETAIGAGAQDYCFHGHFNSWLSDGKLAGSAWNDNRYKRYLRNLTSGDRVDWISDMQSDSRIAILYDREADFWADHYDDGYRGDSVNALFGTLQQWRKMSVDIISTSEPSREDSAAPRFTLSRDFVDKYDLILAPGIDHVCTEDLRMLREYVDDQGGLLILGSIAPEGEASDDAFEILGITTVGDAEPSGFVFQAQQHPVFTVPGGFAGPMGSFRISANKYHSLSYETKNKEGWDLLAYEVNDSGRRPSILMDDSGRGVIGYINSHMVEGFTTDVLRVLANMIVLNTRRVTSNVCAHFSESASANMFKSSDGMTRYIHVFTRDGEPNETTIQIRTDRGYFPISAEVMTGDGAQKPLQLLEERGEPTTMEMLVAPSGNSFLRLPESRPPFIMLKIQYEKRETP